MKRTDLTGLITEIPSLLTYIVLLPMLLLQDQRSVLWKKPGRFGFNLNCNENCGRCYSAVGSSGDFEGNEIPTKAI